MTEELTVRIPAPAVLGQDTAEVCESEKSTILGAVSRFTIYMNYYIHNIGMIMFYSRAEPEFSKYSHQRN